MLEKIINFILWLFGIKDDEDVKKELREKNILFNENIKIWSK